MKKAITNKLLAVVLAIAMVLSASVVAFASETTAPTSSTTVSSLDGIASVTINGQTAYYQYDDNTGTNVKYIRAKLDATNSLEDIQSATVVITTTGNTPVIPNRTATTQSGYTYTFILNLLNTRYEVTVGSNTYYLAAGFEKNIAIEDTDPLAIKSATLGTASTLNIYGSVVQNSFMGNTYYVNNCTDWTDENISYYVSGNYTWKGLKSSVTASFTTNNATLGGNYAGGTMDLTGTMPNVTVTNNGPARTYYVTAVINKATSFEVTPSTYAFDFTELNTTAYGAQFATNVTQITNALTAYYDEEKVFSATDSVMDVMQDFIDFAENEGFFAFSTSCSDTYLSSLNGLGEFDAGSMSGWCYMTGAYTPTCKVPMVGAADCTLGTSSLYTWFMTVDYTDHF